MSRHKWFWMIGLSVFAIDQASKLWARAAFHEHQSPGFPWPGVFEFTLTYNKGIAFGLFPGIGLTLAPVAVAIAIGCWHYSRRHPSESILTHVAMALLSAGALGNLYDRLVFQKVTDMFWVRVIDFPVFNVADSSITIAAAILLLKWGGEIMPKPRRAPDGQQTQDVEETPKAPATAASDGQ